MAYLNIPRLPDPTTNPQGPGFSAQVLTNNKQGMSNRLNNGGIIAVRFSGDYWSIGISYPELTIAQAATILPFLESVSGGFTDFYVQLPTNIHPVTGIWNEGTAVLRCEGALVKLSDTSFSVASWSTRGGDVNAGDLLKFSNSNKIYKVTSTTLVSNTKTVFLNSPIISNISSAGLELNYVKIKVRMPGNFTSPQITSRGVYDAFSITLEENIL